MSEEKLTPKTEATEAKTKRQSPVQAAKAKVAEATAKIAALRQTQSAPAQANTELSLAQGNLEQVENGLKQAQRDLQQAREDAQIAERDAQTARESANRMPNNKAFATEAERLEEVAKVARSHADLCVNQIQSRETALSEATDELDAAKAKAEEAVRKAEKAQAELPQAENELRDAEAELAQAWREWQQECWKAIKKGFKVAVITLFILTLAFSTFSAYMAHNRIDELKNRPVVTPAQVAANLDQEALAKAVGAELSAKLVDNEKMLTYLARQVGELKRANQKLAGQLKATNKATAAKLAAAKQRLTEQSAELKKLRNYMSNDQKWTEAVDRALREKGILK